MGLKVVQWNSRGFSDKVRLNAIDFKDIDVMCVQETLLGENRNLLIRNFWVIRKDMKGQGDRGVCFAIRRGIEFAKFDMEWYGHRSIEIQGIKVKIKDKDKEILIVNVYRHPSSRTPRAVWENLFELRRIYPYMLVVGDFNAHHQLWGCASGDAEGGALADAITEAGMVVQNDGRDT